MRYTPVGNSCNVPDTTNSIIFSDIVDNISGVSLNYDIESFMQWLDECDIPDRDIQSEASAVESEHGVGEWCHDDNGLNGRTSASPSVVSRGRKSKSFVRSPILTRSKGRLVGPSMRVLRKHSSK